MKYIIVNSVKDGNRYLRKENKQIKNTTSDTKCVHLVDFAKEVVVRDMARKGCLKALDVLDSTSGAVLLLEILREYACDDYFVPRESLSQETAAEVWSILAQLRMGETTEAYAQEESSSVKQIKALIERYEKKLEERDLCDVPLLYKKAIAILQSEIASEDGTKKQKVTYVISDVCKQSLTAVEQEFLRLYTKENYSVFQLLTSLKEKEFTYLKGVEFFRAYGISNEVSYVISQILEKKQSLGEVEIFYSSAEYEPFLEAQFSARGIPYAMTKRQMPADNPYLHMMKYVLDWAAADFSYEALKPVMILSYDYKDTYFSEIRAGIGWGMERYHNYIQMVRNEKTETDENKRTRQEKRQAYCKCLEELLAVFEIKKGEVISYEEVFWRLVGAVKSILGQKESYKNFAGACKAAAQQMRCLGSSQDRKEVISVLLEEVKTITYSDEETTSAVAIRKMDSNVHILDRKHIYVLGMSNTHFTGSVVESPVLSDEALEQFLDTKAGYVNVRKHQEEKKKQALRMTLATRGEGTLCIGYTSYDTINLRSMSPAIPFIRMMQDANVEEKDIIAAGYENIVRKAICYSEEAIWKEAEKIAQEMVEKAAKKVEEEKNLEQVEDVEFNSEDDDYDVEEEVESPISKWSATSLQQLLACPLQFYYQRVLHLPDENYKLPQADRWLPASEKGTLAHEIMEHYCNAVFLNKTVAEVPSMIQEELLENILQTAVEKMLTSCPYMSKASYEIECELIRRNCRIYLEKMHKEFSDPANKWMVIACEAEVSDVVLQIRNGDCFANLHFTAKMDRLDAYVDENGVTHYRIVDYKSGSQKKHQEKIDCHENVQHIVYKLALTEAKNDSEKHVVEEVRFLHFFEEDPQKQEIILSDSAIADFPVDVKEFVIMTLKESKYEKASVSMGKKESKEEDRQCSYCTYKDICMANVRGEKL